jgi:hypothetical protein
VIKDANGQIRIPRQSTLVFDIQLLKVYKKADTGAVSLVAGPSSYRRTGF